MQKEKEKTHVPKIVAIDHSCAAQVSTEGCFICVIWASLLHQSPSGMRPSDLTSVAWATMSSKQSAPVIPASESAIKSSVVAASAAEGGIKLYSPSYYAACGCVACELK